MNEKTIILICTIITIVGFLLIIPFGTSFFENKTIGDMLANEGERGAIYGRVEYVLNENKPTLFILYDGNKTKVFSPNSLKVRANDFVTIYGETKTYNGEKEIFAYYVVVE